MGFVEVIRECHLRFCLAARNRADFPKVPLVALPFGLATTAFPLCWTSNEWQLLISALAI